MAIEDLMQPGGRQRRPEGPRRSGARALIFWVVALAAGGAAAMLLRFYIEKRGQSSTSQALTKVVVSSMDLPIATTIRTEHIKEVDWPIGAQPPGIIHDPKQVVGRVLMAKVVQGEPILVSKLAAKDAGRGLAALIPQNMRAMAVRVDDVVGVAGFVHPEDRVDVIVTIRPTKPPEAEPTSKIILQNVKVLAVGKELEVQEQSRNKPIPVTVATLLITPEESERLSLAANQGRILLTLRSWTDAESIETPGAIPSALLEGIDFTGRSQRVAAAESATLRRKRKDEPPPPPTAPPVVATPHKDVVEILRGDRFEERKFEPKEKQ